MIRSGQRLWASHRAAIATATALSMLAASATCQAQDATKTGTYPGSNGRNLYYDGSNGLLYTVGEAASLYSTQFIEYPNTTSNVSSSPSTILNDPAFPVNACEMVIQLLDTVSLITATGTAKGVACHSVGLGNANDDAINLAHVDLFVGYNGYWNADRDFGGWCYSAEQPNNQNAGFTQGCPYEGQVDATVTPLAVDLGRIWNPVAANVTNTGDLVHYAQDILGYAAIQFTSGPLSPNATQQTAIVAEMKAAGIDLTTYEMVAFKPHFAVLKDSDWHVDGDKTVLCDPAHFSEDMVSKAPYLLGAIYCGTLTTAATTAQQISNPTTNTPTIAVPTQTYPQAVPNQAGTFHETVKSTGAQNGSHPNGAGGVNDMTGGGDLTDMTR